MKNESEREIFGAVYSGGIRNILQSSMYETLVVVRMRYFTMGISSVLIKINYCDVSNRLDQIFGVFYACFVRGFFRVCCLLVCFCLISRFLGEFLLLK